jgi:predicted oxidoreductase
LLRLPCHPHPITGSRRLSVLEEAVAATRLRLDAQDWTEILVAATGVNVL